MIEKQSVVDLLIPGQTPGIKGPLVDLFGKPELLFFGPDGMSLMNTYSYYWPKIGVPEGTADMMDWAARKYQFTVLIPISDTLLQFMLVPEVQKLGGSHSPLARVRKCLAVFHTTDTAWLHCRWGNTF
jgi:hypothetical protein